MGQMCYASHRTGRVWSSKSMAKSSPCVPCTQDIHTRSYRTSSGVGEGVGGIGLRRLGIERELVSQRNEKWEHVDYPDKKSIFHGWEIGLDDLHRNMSPFPQQGVRRREGRYCVVWGSNVEWEMYVNVTRHPLYRIL